MKSHFGSLFLVWTLMLATANGALHHGANTHSRRGGNVRQRGSQETQSKNIDELIKPDSCLAFIGSRSGFTRNGEKKSLPSLSPRNCAAGGYYVHKVRGGDYQLPGPVRKQMQPLRATPPEAKGQGKNRGNLSSYQFNSSQIAVFASIVRSLTFVGLGNFFYGVMRLCLATINVLQRRHESTFILKCFRLSDLDAFIPNIIEIYVARIILKSADALREVVSSQSPDDVETLVYSMSLFDKALKQKRPPIFLKGVAAAAALAAAIKAIFA